jgi:hypothetical protein
MSGILDILGGVLGTQQVNQIGNKVGLDGATTGKLVAAALPLLISALAKNSSSQKGAQDLHNALTNDHDGSILDEIGGLLGGSLDANGSGILGHIFGNKQQQIQQGLGASTGVDDAAVGQVLEMLAPVVMGALGRQTASQGLDAGGLAGMLNGAAQSASQSAPDVLGSLVGMLDSNKDGSVIDDVAGMLGKLFKRS